MIHKTAIAARLDADLVDRLRVVSALTGTAQTTIIETAVADHLTKIIKRRKIADLVDQTRTARNAKPARRRKGE